MCEKSLTSYSRRELALRNGHDREDVWCGYKGIIYDVGRSKLWRNGTHYEHWAGQDLTDEMPEAPHTDRVFEKFRVVGKLSD